MQELAATYTPTRVWYSDGENYQRTADGTWRQVQQIDFKVNWNISGGQKYLFFVDGMFTNLTGQYQSPSVHITNESLGNNPHQDGADNQYLSLTMVNGVPSGNPTKHASSQDANVQIFGSPIAQPPFFLLLE
jgi:hypothetical protein